MFTEIIHASLTVFDTFNNDEVKMLTGCWNCNVKVIVNGSQVSQPTVNSRESTLFLSFFEFSNNFTTIPLIISCLTHIIVLFSNFASFLFKLLELTSEITFSLVLSFKLLNDGLVLLLMICKLLASVVEFLLVWCNLIIALLKFAVNLISSIFDAFYLSFLALDISLYLSHLIVNLIQWTFNLLPLTT